MVKTIGILHNQIMYEGEFKKMRPNKEKRNGITTENDSNTKSESDSKSTTITENPLFVTIISALFVGLISAGFSTYVSNKINENNIKMLNTLIETAKKDLGDDIDRISQNLNTHELQANSKFEELNRAIGRLQGGTGIASTGVTIDQYGKFAQAVQDTYKSEQSINNSSGLTLCNDDDIIGKDKNTGIEYTKKDLKETNIIFHYVENGEDVYFNGQYDDNGYWDGNCIINRYLDGKLTLIMDAEYESGKLISYKQVFSYEKKFLDLTYNVWAVAERVPEGGVTRGFTWTYYKTNEYEQKFTSDLVIDTDILNAEEFMSKTSLSREGYYNGYISNGYYNDNTGDAYTINYSRDGFIRLLYVGNFKDGDLTDYTGKAWYIILGYDNTNYYYYQGRFENAQRLDNTKSPWPPLSPEEINSLTSGKNWGCDLNWKIDT